MAGIATASNEQKLGIGEVTGAVSQLDQVTQRNAAQAEENAGAAEQLSTQSATLHHAVDALSSIVQGAGRQQAGDSGSGPETARLQKAAHANEARDTDTARTKPITKAIAAHGMWKARLKKAIDTGTADISPEKASVDDQCEFGKWLHSCPKEYRDSGFYKEILPLHACFHREAGQVLRLALSGQKQKALQCVAIKGSFSSASEQLTGRMMEWKSSLLSSIRSAPQHGAQDFFST